MFIHSLTHNILVCTITHHLQTGVSCSHELEYNVPAQPRAGLSAVITAWWAVRGAGMDISDHTAWRLRDTVPSRTLSPAIYYNRPMG